MSDTLIAKVIMAINNLGTARSLLNEASKEGGDLSTKIEQIAAKIKNCEEDLRSIQLGK